MVSDGRDLWRGVGEARRDSRIFWKSLFEIYLILLFFFPKLIVGSTAALFDGLAEFGSILDFSAGFVFWSGVDGGRIVAIVQRGLQIKEIDS